MAGGSGRGPFERVRRAEKEYARQLRKVARHVDELVRGLMGRNADTLDPQSVSLLENLLRQYANVITPWAETVAKRMLAEVNKRDVSAWEKYSADMGNALRKELRTQPVGRTLAQLQAEQVDLITSLPREAAQRVHKLAFETLSLGERGGNIIDDIMRTGQVTQSRANLIARTEVARAGSLLTQARALGVGSDGYIWRTAGDSDVRKSHKQMEGKFVRWDSPPTLSDGTTTHAGQIYNCRCVALPVVPDIIE